MGNDSKSNGLTRQQEAYCIARAAGSSPIPAYRKAFKSAKGKDATVKRAAMRLETRPLVKMRIHELMQPAKQAVQAEVTEKILVDLDRALFENAAIAFSDVRRLFHQDGRMRAPHEWDDATAAAVSSIKVRELFGEGKDGVGAIGTVTEIKLWDKGGAIDRTMRHFGGYEKDKAAPVSPLDGVARDALRQFLDAVRARIAAGSVVAEQPEPRRLAKHRKRGRN